jgi:hypothetical protein
MRLISWTLQSGSEHKLTGIDEIVKISSPVQRICRGRYIDSKKLIYDDCTR